MISFGRIRTVNVLAGAWVSQAERAAIIASDRLYLTQVILAQGYDASADLIRANYLAARLLPGGYFYSFKGSWTPGLNIRAKHQVGDWSKCPTS